MTSDESGLFAKIKSVNYCFVSSRLNFWDLGGQEELQALWDKYFAECHAIIYTVDSNDRERVEESKKSFDVMIKNENLKGVPLLLLANKQDLPGKLYHNLEKKQRTIYDIN